MKTASSPNVVIRGAAAAFVKTSAVDIQKFPPNAPFVTFNCADYANNPQLLLGQLFGVRKGTYTGAIEQKELIEKADGGILFLDEVYRLFNMINWLLLLPV
ncbi:hypothetical protein PcaKH35_12020 [Parageobacillus caldoxylosilyticus]|nr:hypothetical protein PcaKH35_12020 [Parageobacillus caldoxylosilyticus]